MALKLINISGIECEKSLNHFINAPQFPLVGVKRSAKLHIKRLAGISNLVSMYSRIK